MVDEAIGNVLAGDLMTSLSPAARLRAARTIGQKRSSAMVRAPRWASMRLKRPSPAPTSRTSFAVQVAAFLKQDGVEEHGAAGVAFVDEADVLGGEGLPAGGVVFFGHQNSGRYERAAIMHEWT